MKNFLLAIFIAFSVPVLSQDFLPVDYPFMVKYSPEGYTLITGQSINGNIYIRYFDGTPGSWSDEFISPFSTPNDRGIDIAADADKNVYVTGYVYDDSYDIYRKTVLKYSSSGGHQWATIFEDNDWESSGISIVVEGDNVYSCGFITDHNQGTERDYYVQKLDSWFGNVVWTYQYNDDEFNGDDVATSLLIDNNFLYVMGYSYRGETYLNDIVLIGLDKTYGTIEQDYPEIYENENSNEYPTDFIFAEDLSSEARKNKTAVTSTSDNINTSNPGLDYLTLLFDGEEGSPLLWASTFDGGDKDVPLSIDLTPSGHILVTGYSYQDVTQYDFATILYDSASGNPLFNGDVYFYDNERGTDQGTSVVSNAFGIYATGYSEESQTGFSTVVYNSSIGLPGQFSSGNGRDSTVEGRILWKDFHVPKFSSTIRSERKVYAKSTLDSNGNLIVTGLMSDENGFRYTIYSYDREGKKIFEFEDDGRNYRRPLENKVFNTGIVSSNYPNPFNPETIINFQLPIDSYVTLKIFDIIGREIATLVSDVRKAGSHSVTFNGSNLSSGVYYYRIQAGDLSETRRMILLK